MEPLFSIIVPVYNVEEYLLRCVQSLLNQSLCDYEIILVDDGSKDGSGAICDGLAVRHPCISVLHKSNGGLFSARNAGLAVARGSYISFVDSDDWMEQDTYETLRRHLEAHQPDILNFGCQKWRNGKILTREHAYFPEGLHDVLQIREKILPDSIACWKAFDQVPLPTQMSACMCVYRRAFLEQHGLCFEPEQAILNEDWMFNLSCLCRAESMMILHRYLYNYDTRQTSLSVSYKPDAYERRKNLFARYREELERTGYNNPEIRYRLQNFWLESIYTCYIIEINAPCWNAEVRKRLGILSGDQHFHEYMKHRSMHNCTLKGFVFQWILKFRLHGAFRIIYRMIKKR